MNLSGEVAEVHMRTDAKNLVTTARTNHFPCSLFNSQLFGRLFDNVIGEGRQLDHSSENRGIIGS